MSNFIALIHPIQWTIASSRTSSEDLKNLDNEWAEGFARLEAMLLSKSFAVPVEPVVKPAEVITNVAFLLPHPPGPSARTCLGVGREQPENKLSCVTRLLDCQVA